MRSVRAIWRSRVCVHQECIVEKSREVGQIRDQDNKVQPNTLASRFCGGDAFDVYQLPREDWTYMFFRPTPCEAESI